MKCFICKNEISDESQIKCPRCGAPTGWVKNGEYIFALSQADVKRFREVQIKYINHRDEQDRIKEQKHIEKERQKAEAEKQEALRKAEQERIREQNRIAEEQRIKDEKRVAAERNAKEQRNAQEVEAAKKSAQEQPDEQQMNIQIKRLSIVVLSAFLFTIIGVLIFVSGSETLTALLMFPVAVAQIIWFWGTIALVRLLYKKFKRM